MIGFILNSLNMLQNRGYDSVGVAYVNTNTKVINVNKCASTDKVDALHALKKDICSINSEIVMGHTRWATHGSKTKKNAHPHHSTNKRFYIVHNGIIENYKKLKTMLTNNNYKFYSETDSEVIANLIDFYYTKCDNIEQSINSAVQCVQGTYGLAIITQVEPEKIYLIREGSPIIIAENDDMIVATSEIGGLVNNFNHYMNVESGSLVCCSKDGFIYKNKLDKILIDQSIFIDSPDPYPHWTLKEIYEQPESLFRVLNNGGRIFNNKIKLGGLEKLKRSIKEIDNIILIGCGTSYNACMCAKYYFQLYANLNTITYTDGAEFNLNDIPRYGKTIMILCSQSGETKDLHRCIEIGREKGIMCVGVINVVNSVIAREVDCGIYLNCFRENGVASTKSFTSMIIALFLFALWINQETNNNYIQHIVDDIRKISYQVCMLLKNIVIDKKVLENLNKKTMFLLGKGKMESIAREGALKIKEIAYIHAEGCNGSSLKHGPFALLHNGFPVILLIDEDNKDKMLNVYEEIKSRGAFVYVITELTELDIEKQNLFIVVNNKYCKEVLFVIVLQYIAYNLSILNNINPDRPKNLAKVVTVE
jgi:glucosamine--fructose-6-phosphate aminotransferase (isomerizing)